MRLEATTRLMAARADVNKAQELLTTLGFQGLRLKVEGEDIIKFFYKSYNMPHLLDVLGNPKDTNKTDSIRFKYGNQGVLAVWPGKRVVLLKNTKKGQKHVEIPVIKPEPAPKPVNEPRTGTTNDDDKVPVVHISEALHKEYMRAQIKERYRLSFMHDLWVFFNLTKFGGQMQMPNIRMFKNVSGSRLRLRGHWSPSRRELAVSPRMFNASQEFFVETFLHEMCHQATDEISNMTVEERLDDHKHKGHGQVWSKWMRKVGLNPLRFDPNENTTYMTEEEKVKHQQTKDKTQLLREEIAERGLKPAKLYPGERVIAARIDGLFKGIAVCQAKKARNQWAVVPLGLAKKGLTSGRFTWWIQPEGWTFADPDDYPIPEGFTAIKDVITKQYQDERVDRAERRAEKRINRGWL